MARGTRSRLAGLLGVLMLAAALPPLGASAHEDDGSQDADASCDPDDPEGYQRAIDLTFPVAGPVEDRSFENDYHDERSGGRRHQATDIKGPKLRTVHAALPGEVTFAPMQKPSYGYMLRIRHDNGLTTAYVHLNDDTPGTRDASAGPEWAYAPGIREGVRVERGQWIGYLGDSGNAKGIVDHLHFEIHDEQLDDPCPDGEEYRPERVNPYASLREAVERGDVPTAPEPAPVERLAGSDRVRTATAIAEGWQAAEDAVIVPEGSHSEALVAAPLAAALDAPVLLSGGHLRSEVADALERLGVQRVHLVDASGALAQVADELESAGMQQVRRLAADGPAALTAVVGRELAELAGPPERVLLALGAHEEPSRAWPDALSAGALAAERTAPVLLTRGDELPEPVAELLAELAPARITVVGGTAAVSAAVEDEAAEAAGGAATDRLAGANRYATSLAVAEAARAQGLDAAAVWLATGHAFPDALAAGPAAARAGAPVVLLDGAAVDGAPETQTWLREHADALDEGVVLGGKAAVAETVRERVSLLLR